MPSFMVRSKVLAYASNFKEVGLAWKIGEVQPTQGPKGLAYGFSIQDEHGAPVLTIGYENEKVAEDGKVAMEALLGNASFIVADGKLY